MVNFAQCHESNQTQNECKLKLKKLQLLFLCLALVKTSTGMATTGGTVGMTFAQIKPGQTLKATVPGIRQMQLQQIPIAQQQQRKNAAGATSRSVCHSHYLESAAKNFF